MAYRPKQTLWEWRGVWSTTPLIACAVLAMRGLGLLQLWELDVYDLFVRWQPPQPVDTRVVIVGIDENDLRTLGQSIIDDRTYADLLKKLKAMQPRAIGLDVYRDLPAGTGHQDLIQQFKTTPNLVGIEKLVGDANVDAVSASAVLKAKGQIGSNDLMLDKDGKLRRTFLTVSRPLADGTKEELFSFGAYLGLFYLQKAGVTIQIVPHTNNWWQLGDQVFVPIEPDTGGYVRADAGDYQVLINYRGPRQHFETVSLMDVMQQRVPRDWAKDKVVLIGAVSESAQDLFPVPYTQSPGQRMPGVEVHANVASQIISVGLDDRPLIKTLRKPLEILWIVFWTGVGAILTWRMRRADGGKSLSWLRLSLIGVALGLLWGGSYIAFLLTWWLPVVPATVGLLTAAVGITAYIARSAGQIRNTFGRYLSDEIVATLLESPEGLRLGGERRSLTIFTSDLRGFTATAERLQPEEVVKVLNFYLGAMAEVITKYQGTIDEFMGDGILVLFGAPVAREDDAERAIACGIEMQLALQKVNEQMAAWNLPPLEMGIGINTGEVVVGNIGSEKRAKYGIVGSQVNLTYRIESYTVGGQILISESTRAIVRVPLEIRDSRQVSPKGVKEPITIYDVTGLGGDYGLALPQEADRWVDLRSPQNLCYAILEGKDIIEKVYQAQVIALCQREALVVLRDGEIPPLPQPLANLKMNLMGGDLPDQGDDDFYAKVLDKVSPQPDRFWIRFTSRPPQIQAYFQGLYERAIVEAPSPAT